MKELVGAIILVGIAVALLAIRIILTKNGHFSSMHIGDSKAMRKRGIHCVVSQDREARKAADKRLDVKKM